RVVDGDSLVDGKPVIGARRTPGAEPPPLMDLPGGTRGWEAIPGVIRDDGVDCFRVEVDTNGPVTGVTIPFVEPRLVPPEDPPVRLRDDGSGADRTAGDFVFTAGPFCYNTAIPIPPFYEGDSASPAGLYIAGMGPISVEELDHSTTTF